MLHAETYGFLGIDTCLPAFDNFQVSSSRIHQTRSVENMSRMTAFFLRKKKMFGEYSVHGQAKHTKIYLT